MNKPSSPMLGVLIFLLMAFSCPQLNAQKELSREDAFESARLEFQNRQFKIAWNLISPYVNAEDLSGPEINLLISSALSRRNVQVAQRLAEKRYQRSNSKIDLAWSSFLQDLPKRMFNPPNYTLRKVESMEDSEEIAPVILGETAVLGGRESFRLFRDRSYLSPEGNKPMDLYFLSLGKWKGWEGDLKKGNQALNNLGETERPLCKSMDGGFYFVRENLKKGEFQLLKALQKEGKWQSMPVPKGELPETGPLSEASLTSGGKVFVFSRKTNAGTHDLYYSRLNNGIWSTPEPISGPINTDKDERSPFLHPNGKLYFASDGHPGHGGLDIFYSLQDEQSQSWGNPLNLGYPLNSGQDDFYYVSGTRDSTGLLVSNRDKKRGDSDIFSFVKIDAEMPDCVPSPQVTLCYTFSDRRISRKPFMHSLQFEFSDGTLRNGLQVDHCFAEPGKYLYHINIVDSLTGKIIQVGRDKELDLEEKTEVPILTDGNRQAGEALNFLGEMAIGEEDRMSGVRWEFGDGGKSENVNSVHVYAEPGEYLVKMEVDYFDVTKGIQRKLVGCEVVQILDKNELPPAQKPINEDLPEGIELGFSRDKIRMNAENFRGLSPVDRFPVNGGFQYIWCPQNGNSALSGYLPDLIRLGFKSPQVAQPLSPDENFPANAFWLPVHLEQFSQDSQKEMQALFEWMSAHPKARIGIESLITPEEVAYQEEGNTTAEAIRNYLKSKGINPTRISIISPAPGILKSNRAPEYLISTENKVRISILNPENLEANF